MPKMGRRLAGRAAMATTLKKERAKEHLKQMLEQSRTQSNDNALQALLQVRGELRPRGQQPWRERPCAALQRGSAAFNPSPAPPAPPPPLCRSFRLGISVQKMATDKRQSAQGNQLDLDGPVMLQKRLQSAQRVLKFISTNTVSISVDALKTECR